MNTRKTILLAGFVVGIIIVSVGYVVIAQELSKPDVKGVSTTISPSPTVAPSPTLFSTPTPTDVPSTKIQPTPTKQYGGWYWREGMSRAQVWIGTDSAGRDIWIDRSPTSTSTPAQKPAIQQQLSTQGNTVGTVNYLQSCSKDGSNQNIPKCP